MASCILTTKDISILETMLERNPEKSSALACLMRAKISAATVVFRDDVPETAVTLNSRVSYRVDGGEPDTRIVAQAHMNSAVGCFLPITTMRGLALLGMMQGETMRISGRGQAMEDIELVAVLHQPEAAQRGRPSSRPKTAPAFRLIQGGKPDRPAIAGFDEDWGPGAA